MTARGRRLRAGGGAAVLAAALLLTGCASGSGTADPEPAERDEAAEYVRLLEECEIVSDERIAQIVGVDGVRNTFHGAVCRWEVAGAGPEASVTLNWFERGSMRTEKSAAEQMGYTVDNEKIGGAVVYVMRDPDDPQTCGATVRAPGAGVVGWWVTGHPDPCPAAWGLAEATLSHSY